MTMNLSEINLHYILYGFVFIVLLAGIFYIRTLLAERNTLRELAYRDPVTGLLNRNGFEHFWSTFKGKDNLALLSLDLDRFKEINDSYGHNAGDQLLKEVSEDLQQVTNKNLLAFRMGGDEFLFIMKNRDPNQVEILAGLILSKISRPYHIQERDMSVTGSIGISLCHASKVDRARMLEEADRAMYHAKRLGKNRYYVFSRPAPDGQVGGDKENVV
ncbi:MULTISPECIES: GGDEF domain-containing protein [Paenibacillus]|uniref:GGDEF domain-containing protein n=1 Tax=Paenibacillus TaxID=44249 RepID=UPI002FE386B9